MKVYCRPEGGGDINFVELPDQLDLDPLAVYTTRPSDDFSHPFQPAFRAALAADPWLVAHKPPIAERDWYFGLNADFVSDAQ